MELIELKNVSKVYQSNRLKSKDHRNEIIACNNVSFEIKSGETLGLVGESGSGKSTIGKMILGIELPTQGEISYNPAKFDEANTLQTMQVIFQNTLTALNPWLSALEIVMEPLRITMSREAAKVKASEMLTKVGIKPEQHSKRPQSFSGGQRQRIGIARAISTNPQLIVCDEPVSALDVSIQAHIINLLKELQASDNLTYLFISHDLSIVRSIANRIVVLYKGTVVEMGETERIFSNPIHPYTQSLLAAIPIPDPIEARRKLATIDANRNKTYTIDGVWTQIAGDHYALL